jgi:hypothetical protein
MLQRDAVRKLDLIVRAANSGKSGIPMLPCQPPHLILHSNATGDFKEFF